MLSIDGAAGEGGGQILRSALALSLITSTPFRIDRIRAGRKKPGLLRQHLTAVQAATDIGRATVEGASLGSTSLTFHPHGVHAGSYSFNVGTAGSAMLVLQTVLPALLQGDTPSDLTLEGGTHNPNAPPFDFLQQAFLPLLGRMGASVTAVLERAGFYPAGGGRCRVRIQPAPKLEPLHLLERGPLVACRATAWVAALPRHIAERELEVVGQALPGWQHQCIEVPDAHGPGNVLMLTVESAHLTEVFTGFGERGVRAEKVAAGAIAEARTYLASSVPVGQHLADQLLLPLALAGEGSFRTQAPTLHTTTNAQVIRMFLPVAITTQPIEDGVWQMQVSEVLSL